MGNSISRHSTANVRIRCKIIPKHKMCNNCSKYYYDLQSSNPLFNSSILFLFLRAYRSLLKDSTERFIKNSKERFTKISKEQAVVMKLCT